jgi:hypothetical protein
MDIKTRQLGLTKDSKLAKAPGTGLTPKLELAILVWMGVLDRLRNLRCKR